MNQTYTLRQAMDKLGLTSRFAFHHLANRHPHAFVIVNQRRSRDSVILYDKQVLDNFAKIREYLKKQKGQP
jgi:hypothetical protein